MNSYHIAATKSTPEIKFVNGLLEMRGVSIPENAIEFYKPLLTIMSEYCANPNSETTVNLYLYYFNTSSSKCLLGIFNHLEKVHKRLTRVKVNWHYDANDEDFRDTAKDYEELVKVDFNFIPETGMNEQNDD